MRYILVFAFVTIFAIGCNKNHDETRSSASSLTDPSAPASASASGTSIAEFSSLEATSWVNGSPFSLAEARSKNVVIIEAWHPA